MNGTKDPVPSWDGSARIPSLDGLRAVSILLVLWTHFVPTIVDRGSAFWIRTARETQIGVDVFFVISGFLITLLLLRESDRTGSISLRGFFARRALRLLPAFAAYLGFVGVYAGLGYARVNATDWVMATTYTTDFVALLGRGAPWVFAHLWSLAVEEHFYVVWPIALVALGRRRAVTALMITLALSPAMRVFLWAEFPWPVMCGLLKFITLARLDPVAAGCLLAYVVQDPASLSFRRPSGRADVVRWVAAAVLVGSAVGLTAAGFFEVAIRATIKAGVIASLVHYAVTRPASLSGRLLNSRPMTALGLLSYSLYLWQQPFLDRTGPLRMSRWPANLPLAFACAVASYLLIERPFLGLKHRLGRPAPTYLPR
ncbi:MAG TPA: acyltransferase, partial [Isosphaeraceae bacterium]